MDNRRRSLAGRSCQRTADLYKECNRIENPQIGSLIPKTLSIGRGSIGKIQNIVVPAHEVAHSRGDGQIDVWLILGIPLELEDARDIRNDRSSLFECCKESYDHRVRQCRRSEE